MPFKSEAQRRYLWMKEPRVAKEFSDKTPKGKKLPYHVKKKKKDLLSAPRIKSK